MAVLTALHLAREEIEVDGEARRHPLEDGREPRTVALAGGGQAQSTHAASLSESADGAGSVSLRARTPKIQGSGMTENIRGRRGRETEMSHGDERESASAAGGRFRRIAVALAGWLAATAVSAQVWEVGEQGLVFSTGPQGVGQFGQVTASGDFNGDGYRDLAVGAPFWDAPAPTAAENAGRVQIHLGSSQGLSETPFLEMIGALVDMGLGSALAAGNFDPDFADELAIGAPGFDLLGVESAGRVFVLDSDGGAWTLTFWTQGQEGLPGTAETDDRFGEVLAVGDFDNDGRGDLAVGIPYEDVLLVDSGAIQVLYGSATGLTADGALLVVQSTVVPPEQAGAAMGRALAAGDFNADDQFWDLAVGFPGFDVGGVGNAGGVAILFGGSGGLSTLGAQLIDDNDVGGALNVDDGFGWALAAGDFDRTTGCWMSFDCRTDLAIGVPGQTVDGADDAGLVVFAYGGAGGIQVGGAQRVDQGDLSPLVSSPEPGDRFGSVLWSEYLGSSQLDGPPSDFTPSADDLVIGVPAEKWLGTAFQGVVHLVFGSATGLNATPGGWQLANPGLSSAPAAAFDNFGYAIGVGDFDNDEWDDLAIGVVGRDAGASNSGMVQVLYGALFADGFESGGTSNW